MCINVSILRSHNSLSDYELGRLLSREGDNEAARKQFDLVLSGKPLEATTHGRKGKYSMEVGVLISRPKFQLTLRYSKHFISVPTLLLTPLVATDLFSIFIPIPYFIIQYRVIPFNQLFVHC